MSSLRITCTVFVTLLATSLGHMGLASHTAIALNSNQSSNSQSPAGSAPTDQPDKSVDFEKKATPQTPQGGFASMDVPTQSDVVTVAGAVWDSGDPGTVEFRTKSLATGMWSAWEALATEEPDSTNSADEETQAKNGTEPLVISDASTIEFRSDRLAQGFKAEFVVEGDNTSSAPSESATPEQSESASPGLEGGAQNTAYTSGESADAGAFQASTLNNASSQTAQNVAAAPPGSFFSYKTRGQWGAAAPRSGCSLDTVSANSAVTVHHTAGKTQHTVAQVPGILRGIQSYHQKSRGWCDIGYHILIDNKGNIYEGRAGGLSNAVVGAHASGFNSGTMGVSVLGTYSQKAPTAVVNSIAKVAAWQAKHWGYTPTSKVTLTSGGGSSKYAKGTRVTLPRIFGHRDTGNTDCPGNGLYSQLGTIRSQASKYYQQNRYTTRGAISAFYKANTSKTGAPVSDEKALAGGAYQKFAKGTVHWSQKTGAHFTKKDGNIQKLWSQHSWERGFLGYPVGEQTDLKNRRGAYYQSFQGGMILYHSAVGTHYMQGAILTKWKQAGWERSVIGLPKNNERAIQGSKPGAYQTFERGSIHWSKDTGAHITTGAIRSAWESQGWEQGRLGYPTGDEHSWSGKVRQNFQGGYITWTSTSGAQIFYT